MNGLNVLLYDAHIVRYLLQKNGGCDHMFCSQCQIHFSWSKAKIYAEKNKTVDYQSYFRNK
jgi:hypothetical protein